MKQDRIEFLLHVFENFISETNNLDKESDIYIIFDKYETWLNSKVFTQETESFWEMLMDRS